LHVERLLAGSGISPPFETALKIDPLRKKGERDPIDTHLDDVSVCDFCDWNLPLRFIESREFLA
jgi:hypothetical protein